MATARQHRRAAIRRVAEREGETLYLKKRISESSTP